MSTLGQLPDENVRTWLHERPRYRLGKRQPAVLVVQEFLLPVAIAAVLVAVIVAAIVHGLSPL